jgi:uncharacterized protein YceK
MKKIIFLLWLMIFLSGCSTIYLFLPMNMTDQGKTSEGELYVKDSRRNWNTFINSAESSFQKEIRGEELWNPNFTPVGQPKTWPEFWGENIRQIRLGEPVLYENPERLTNYIHERRAELGLPPAE